MDPATGMETHGALNDYPSFDVRNERSETVSLSL